MSKKLQKRAYTAIHKQFKDLGLILDQKGYLLKTEDNLHQYLSNWPTIKNEISSGNGNELKPDKNGIVKFNASHSSSAFCINNFAHLKEFPQQSHFLNFSNFKVIQFEKKLHTGISRPNLDLYLETIDHVIGVESKFTEHLYLKKPNTNLDKYVDRRELTYLPPSFSKILKYYIDQKGKYFLDVAQLIKHTIGLRKAAGANSKKPTLVYIYWLPANSSDIEEFRKHETELEEFQKLISEFIDFYPLSYLEYWAKYESSYPETFLSLKRRYSVTI